MRDLQVQRLSLLAITFTAACATSAIRTSDPEPPSQPTVTPSTQLVGRPDREDCSVTIPRQAPPEIREYLFGSDAAYGNEQLWVGGLWPDGMIVADETLIADDGSVGMKFGWYRKVRGKLEITGRRLDDGSAPPLRAGVPEDGYADIGFIPSGVSFPTDGCWEVTGRVGDVTLTFVTFVIKQA